MNLKQQDRITVAREIEDEENSEFETFESDGQLYEEIEVFNWVTVEQGQRVRPGEIEQLSYRIYAGDRVGGPGPKAVTHWIATDVKDEFGIDAEKHGIEIINPEDDGVELL